MPALTGEQFLDALSARLIAIYEQSLGFERAAVPFATAKNATGQMVFKAAREFSALVTTLDRKDPVLDLWVEFEDEFRAAIENLKSVAIGIPDITDAVRTLILSLMRLLKTKYPQKAALISAKLKEFESGRLVGARS